MNTIEYPTFKSTVKAPDIKIGDLIVTDIDHFMLGDRLRVSGRLDNGALYCEAWQCGERSRWVCSDHIINPDEQREYYRIDGETLFMWTEKHNEIKRKRYQEEQAKKSQKTS